MADCCRRRVCDAESTELYVRNVKRRRDECVMRSSIQIERDPGRVVIFFFFFFSDDLSNEGEATSRSPPN